MKKKTLMGSIIAVSLLICVSFTSVVGYNSVESDVKISPLFNIRSSRAIDKKGEGFTTEYVGKGEEITIILPTFNIINTKLQRFIDIISRMDDKTLYKFGSLVNTQINKENIHNIGKIKDINTILNYFKANINDLEKINLTDRFFDNREYITEYCYPTGNGWYPGCVIQYILGMVALVIIAFLIQTLDVIAILISILLAKNNNF